MGPRGFSFALRNKPCYAGAGGVLGKITLGVVIGAFACLMILGWRIEKGESVGNPNRQKSRISFNKPQKTRNLAEFPVKET